MQQVVCGDGEGEVSAGTNRAPRLKSLPHFRRGEAVADAGFSHKLAGAVTAETVSLEIVGLMATTREEKA
jgi:hypothetical protein